MGKTTIEQALSAARAVRAQWPQSEVNCLIFFESDTHYHDEWSGDRAGHINVQSKDPDERRAIAKAAAWTFHCPQQEGKRASLTGKLAGVPAYFTVPAVPVTFDADAEVTCDADGTTETVGVVVTACVVLEGLREPHAEIMRLLDVERGRDLLDDVKAHDTSRRASCPPYSNGHRSQLLDLEAIAIAQAKVTALALEPARA